MKTLMLSTFVLLFLTVSVLQSEQATTPTDDEYEVLSALINEFYLTGEYKSIVITNPTCCEMEDVDFRGGGWKVYVDQLSPISFETLEDYAARNKQPLSFERRFKLKTKYQIVPNADVEKLFPAGMPEEGWKVFYSKYPGSNGYLKLSRVGFNKAKDQAFVSTGWIRGPRYGEGHYVVLGKQNGSWKVLNRMGTWIV